MQRLQISSATKARHAFTLIELLVVIAIIAILAAILFPVFAQARGKARQAACLSNQKQFGLAMMQYVTDYDGAYPFKRITCATTTGGPCFWWTSQETVWKDLIYPYIKSGGRDYKGGVTYTTPGDAGIFGCLSNPALWQDRTESVNAAWGFGPNTGVGDETSRYPRGYAINSEAGCNELGLDNPGDTGSYCKTIWPNVGDTFPEGGTDATLSSPASTIMIAEVRTDLIDTAADYSAYQCTQNGRPAGGTPYSCIYAHESGFMNAAFFDGHVKAVRGTQAIKDDLWGIYGPKARGTGNGYKQQGWTLSGAQAIKQWQ